MAEIRLATGKATGYVTELNALNSRVSSTIARVCKVVASGVTVPTLRQETLTETIRDGINSIPFFATRQMRTQIVLSRRPMGSVTSIVENDVTLTADEYEYDANSGLVLRLQDDNICTWSRGKITVVYVAGWAVVPDDLKLAASKLASLFWTESTRDANLKRVKVEGISEREYWVPPTTDPLIPNEVMSLLGPYTNYFVG